MDWSGLFEFLARGGPALWVIAVLSIVTLTVILWKVWRLMQDGAWSGSYTEAALSDWCGGRRDKAMDALLYRGSLRARLAHAAMCNRASEFYTDETAREETERVAKSLLLETRSGLRALELIATIAPLVGLLGTVLGMIAAFQALQDSGNQADPAVLAGGIWEALLTTAAGMAVAIPAATALSWFESIADKLQSDMEDAATRIFTAPDPTPTLATRTA
jgi:biopolymer transport protein ExbB